MLAGARRLYWQGGQVGYAFKASHGSLHVHDVHVSRLLSNIGSAKMLVALYKCPLLLFMLVKRTAQFSRP